MSLFVIEVASGLIDRLASITKNVDNVMIAARSAQPPGNMFERVYVQNNYDPLFDLMTPAETVEGQLSGVSVMAAVPSCDTLVNAFDTHTQRVANVSLDTYLLNSGLQVSEYFGQLYAYIRSQNLSAHNIYAEEDILMATNFKSGTGNWVFTQHQNLGNGYPGAYTAVPLNSGNQLILANLPSGTSVTTTLVMSISGVDDFGRNIQAAFSFPSGVQNAEVLVSGSKMRSITNVSTITDDTGVAANKTITFVNKRERIVYIGTALTNQAGQPLIIQ